MYDVLHPLTVASLTRSESPSSGSAARYESQVGNNHHNIVCRSCRAIADTNYTI
nr:hypothetical protein [Mycobacterium lepromatosis]